ncbi:MAG: YdeI/OmpD-associated family protein [Massilia sp.]
MPTLDPRVDAYIAASPEFAQPILTHLRAVVHAACPEVEETIKWSSPHFLYQGMLCHMASFKAHCAFGFWKGSLLFPDMAQRDAMGQFGRITSVKDLPAKKVVVGYIKQAMQLNVDGVQTEARAQPKAPRPLTVPSYLLDALKQNKAAKATFEAGSTSFKREYVDWMEEAKTEATRLRRMEQAIAWLAEGKARNWKYEKC